MTTRCLPFGAEAIALAAELTVRGQPVAVPTETVYGLAGDATSGAAVAGIYAAKGRPAFNPLIVHVPDVAAAVALAEFNEAALRLAERWWPGPMTLVLPVKVGAPLASLVMAGLPTVALRVPSHPAIRALMAATGRPLAAPSANASGTISPTRAAHVMRSLAGRIPLVIDGGPCTVGLESTILSVAGGAVRVLRPGPLDPVALAETARLPLAARGILGAIEAPGQLTQHYAPAKPVRLGATNARPGEWLIGFGAIRGHDSLSAAGDLVEAATRLFDCLHTADTSALEAIAIAPIPVASLGIAINDRLARAAA